MTGAFFVASSGYGAPGTSNLTMLDASRQWKQLRPRLDIADPSFAAAPSGASVVASASPADNVYLSPYSIATATDTAAGLLFDWNSFPRNNSSAWAGESFFDAATGLPTLSGAQGFRSSVWQPIDPAAYESEAALCGAGPVYGPAALQFPPVVVGGVTRRTTAAWRRERQIASAWYFAGMGLRYQHSHIPTFSESQAGKPPLLAAAAAALAYLPVLPHPLSAGRVPMRAEAVTACHWRCTDVCLTARRAGRMATGHRHYPPTPHGPLLTLPIPHPLSSSAPRSHR
jgi:hypothetical protein